MSIINRPITALLAAVFLLAGSPVAAQYFGKNKIAYNQFDWALYESPHFDIYYYPEEEIRTIMFVDLAGSTSIAEELGTIRFSSFLQDWFSDISESIFAWHGYVYQYLGDGFILSWRKNHARRHLRPSRRRTAWSCRSTCRRTSCTT